ncbi:isoleucine--tRNA ligase [Methanococcoides sp. SA1]|nr:isoleucine--tRNA ligase [Methanococcoides sp. SA1]
MQEKQTAQETEEKTNKFWDTSQIFKKSLEKDAPKGDWSFYDGPPFATGLPHYGHIVASIIKDVLPRFWTMKGYKVERKWGWDCHGLPIENIVEKELGSKNKKDIEKLGVDKFNEMCRSKVLSYTEEWKKVIRQLGRWADMDDPYKTMDLEFMESVWWVFKTMYDKDLIYKGHRPMHICPRCETTLSQSEVTEGYKDVKDLSVIAEFSLTDEKETSILAWTTTPWTLIGNAALAVGKDIDYVKIEKQNEEGELVRFILAKEKLEEIFENQEYEIIEEFKGEALLGKKYKPLFPYYAEDKTLENKENAWKVYAGDFVTTEEGTGVVHIAPAFGEDDMKLGQKENLPFIQHVSMDGNFKPETKEFARLNVKPKDNVISTDIEIIKYLHSKGTLFSKKKFAHSYPHCWRCDTPLLNYATSSWFVNVTKIKPQMLELAKNINWSPEHIKEGRWGNWLEGARDWSISRQRFWASVIPIWECECGELKVLGSAKELEDLSGEKVTDLHKHFVDKITFDCEKCNKKMKRVPDVLDTWFDSGSMPFAQLHYPFENQEKFKANMPAQFIAEGADQCRCWFYYMHVLSTGINKCEAFKNVIVNGIVLAEDGKKMSKKLQNYPDPSILMNKYGADALRHYLLTSPVMLADSLNFSEQGVSESYRKINILLSNILNFYTLSKADSKIKETSPNHILDNWILSRLNNLTKEVTLAMEEYNLPAATRPIATFIEDLSTWHVRLSRDRLNQKDPSALYTLKQTLLTLSETIAPFTPFIAENIWQTITENNYKDKSVHLQDYPTPNENLINSDLESEMEIARSIVSTALRQRDKAQIGIKWPLAKATISTPTIPQEKLIEIIKTELNIKELEFEEEKELRVTLDTKLTPALEAEGYAREISRKIQATRKKNDLIKSDTIELEIASDFNDKLKTQLDSIGSQVGASTISLEKSNKKFNYSEVGKIKDKEFEIRFNKL